MTQSGSLRVETLPPCQTTRDMNRPSPDPRRLLSQDRAFERAGQWPIAPGAGKRQSKWAVDGTGPLLMVPSNRRNGARLWENAWDEAADARCSPARQLRCRIDRPARAA